MMKLRRMGSRQRYHFGGKRKEMKGRSEIKIIKLRKGDYVMTGKNS